jgi:phosphoribosylaminoimidazolecarboxamide formyltransferase / IMP cyclohydrolase
MTQHGGKELSYLNVFDTEAAWRLVHRFDAPAVVVVKHANPCGVAVADDVTEAYVRANACDPVSAFGGIVAANRTVTAEMATALGDVFTEVVVAPGFEPEALEILAVKKNLRVMSANAPSPLPFDVRPVDGGLLVQQPDLVADRSDDWSVVTAAQPSRAVGRPRVRLAGLRRGQQQRDRLREGPAGVRDRCRPAEPSRFGTDRRRTIRRTRRGGACASDAFFPFRDGLDAAAAAGITAVIQPGGSVRDDEVIAAADEHGIAMVFTGQRHFRH